MKIFQSREILNLAGFLGEMIFWKIKFDPKIEVSIQKGLTLNYQKRVKMSGNFFEKVENFCRQRQFFFIFFVVISS